MRNLKNLKTKDKNKYTEYLRVFNHLIMSRNGLRNKNGVLYFYLKRKIDTNDLELVREFIMDKAVLSFPVQLLKTLIKLIEPLPNEAIQNRKLQIEQALNGKIIKKKARKAKDRYRRGYKTI